MPRGNVGLLLLSVVLACSVACEGCGTSTSGKASDLIGTRTIDSNGGAYSISYSCSPDPIPLNEPFELSVRIDPKKKQEGGRLAVRVDAQMPEHFHGMNRKPEIRNPAESQYVASGMLFHMPGHWQVHMDITRNGITERAQFDLTLK